MYTYRLFYSRNNKPGAYPETIFSAENDLQAVEEAKRELRELRWAYGRENVTSAVLTKIVASFECSSEVLDDIVVEKRG